ncbi:hypothetical protein BH11ACT8_BH11ACT8_32330 [soil metagenome]
MQIGHAARRESVLGQSSTHSTSIVNALGFGVSWTVLASGDTYFRGTFAYTQC